MPVSKQSQVAFAIAKIEVDMLQMAMSVSFVRTLDGVIDGGVQLSIAGDELATLLSTPANAGQALASEITVALYTFAIAKGVITGAIS